MNIVEKYIEKMRDAQSSDIEGGHRGVDFVLIEMLEELGYQEIVDLWKEQPKWYA